MFAVFHPLPPSQRRTSTRPSRSNFSFLDLISSFFDFISPPYTPYQPPKPHITADTPFQSTTSNMCHGHPRHHPCSHTSINWHYCPSALIDLETGYETPCSNISFAAAQPTNSDCPLQNCQFKSKGGSWTCCSCRQGPNTQGWCTMPLSRLEMDPESYAVEAVETTCDHGCCSKCIRYGKPLSYLSSSNS